MKKEAKDLVTVTIEYDRPFFIFPNLSSEQGNPREYFKMASHALKRLGFYREAKELENFQFTKYEEHFNYIARFLDFNNSKTIKEDEDYIYIKIKKNSEATEQPRVFSITNSSGIKELINEGHDFSLQNCYGRNHLHYLNDPLAIAYLLTENKTNEWFDIFDLDCFNSTYLHNKDFKSFATILNHMYEESPHMAETFLFGTNAFGENAFGEFLKECDQLFMKKGVIPNMDKVSEVIEVLSVLKKVSKEKSEEFMTILERIEDLNPILKEINLKPIIFRAVLDNELSENNNLKIAKLKKI